MAKMQGYANREIAERAKLLQELLLLDLDYRKRRAECPAPQEYATRFPNDAQLIAEVSRIQTASNRDPGDTNAKRFLRNAHAARATARTEQGQFELALADWDEAIAVDSEMQEYLGIERARTEALAGGHAIPAKVAEEFASENVPVAALYHAARVFSLSSAAAERDQSLPSGKRQAFAEQYASRAIELLTEAQGLGYFEKPKNGNLLKEIADFDPLRKREDFQKLLEK